MREDQAYWLFLTVAGTALITGYKRLDPPPVVMGAEATYTGAGAVGAGEVLIKAFVSDALGLTALAAGTWTFNLYGKVDSDTDVTQIVIRVYKRNADGTETELFNVTSSEINDMVVALQTVNYAYAGDAISITDRLVIKFYHKTNSAVSKTTTIYLEGAVNQSRVNISFPVRVGDGDMEKTLYDADGDGLIDAIGGGGGGGDFVHNVDGVLSVAAGVAAFVASKSITINKVYLYGFTLGASSNTIVDIHLNGTTIFTTQGNRPSLAYNDADHVAVSGAPELTSLVTGDVLTMDIDQVAVGSSGLTVVVSLSVAGTGGDVVGTSPVVSGNAAIFDGTSGKIIKDGGALGGDYILLRDEKTQNTAGGTFTSGAWRTRDINTVVSDVGGHCSLPGSNVIRLAAGTYRYRIAPTAEYVGRNKARLYDVTASAIVANGEGASVYSAVGAGVTTAISWLVGVFTIASQNDFRIEHQCGTTNATNGFGQQSNFDKEIYTIAEFWRVG